MAESSPGFEFLRIEVVDAGGQPGMPIAVFHHGVTDLEFVLVPGAAESVESLESHLDDAIEPVGARGLLVARTECTIRTYDRVMGGGVAAAADGMLPATGMSWDEAAAFCTRAALELPTHSEWQRACSGGSSGQWSFGDDVRMLPRYAWFTPDFRSSGFEIPRRVAQKLPNPLGLYDMHGNVSEWCARVKSQPGGWPGQPNDSTYWPIAGGSAADRADGVRTVSVAFGFSEQKFDWLGVRPVKRVALR